MKISNDFASLDTGDINVTNIVCYYAKNRDKLIEYIKNDFLKNNIDEDKLDYVITATIEEQKIGVTMSYFCKTFNNIPFESVPCEYLTNRCGSNYWFIYYEDEDHHEFNKEN